MAEEPHRRLAAVWIADIVGYGELSARDEDLALRVLRELQRLSNNLCETQAGRVAELAGDAVLAVFDSADGAVQAAMAIRDEFLGSPEVRAAKASVRVGVHVGEVIEDPNAGVHGDAVSVATRIVGEADPGQVLVSQAAHGLLLDRTGIELEDRGEFELKGIPAPVRLYSARLVGAVETALSRELLQEAIAPLQLLDMEGIGGMGEIYLARDPGLRRTLAVKVLRSELVADAQARSRFQREATVIAGLSHPNVITIHSVGELGDETPYYVMDHVEGGSLVDRLEQEGPLSVPETRRILGEVASALQAAHGKGIVHRDIKAANVLWDLESGRVLVTDWGIAALDPSVELAPETRLTRTGVFIGSPKYMSPEQLAGDDVGPESDVYSLGLLAFELLTGHGPFQAETPREIMVSHLREDPPNLAEVRKDVDPELASFVERCLAKSPSDRPPASEITRLVPGAGSTLEWPPPGLEPLGAMAYWLALSVGLAMLSVTWPLLLPPLFEMNWGFGGSSGMVSGGFMIVSLSIMVAVGLIIAAVSYTCQATYHFWKGIRLGYGWRTLLEVACDRRGDAGHLITGAKEYSVLGANQRRRLRIRRVVGGVALVILCIVVPLAAALLPLATVSSFWMVFVVLFLGSIPLEQFLEDPKPVLKARKRFKRARVSMVDLSTLVESWTVSAEREGVRVGDGPTGPVRWALPGFAVGVGAVGVVVAVAMGLFAFAIFLLSGTPRWAFPPMERTLTRWAAVAPFEDLRLPPDTTTTAAEAGRILREILAWENPEAEWIGDRPTQERAGDSPLTAKLGLFTSPYALRPDSLVYFAAQGLTVDETAYLRGFSGDPRLPAFRQVARAAALDWYAEEPVSPTAVAAFRPVPDWDAIRELAQVNMAKAAYLVSIGDLVRAEETLRESVSLGFVLSEGTDLLMLMIGVVVADPALDGLAHLYALQERSDELQRLLRRRDIDPASLAYEPDPTETGPGSVVFFDRSRDSRNQISFGAADTTVARALRWTYLSQLVPAVQCNGAVRLCRGPPEELQTYLTDVRPTLVRFPSEEALFDMLAEQMDRFHAALPESGEQISFLARWMRLPSILLFNPRIQTCAAIATLDW